MNQTPSEPGKASASGSALGRFLALLARHPSGVVQFLVFLLAAIVILQNVESTAIDVLFWSIPAIPKLVLILVSMLVGAAIWEVARRWIRR